MHNRIFIEEDKEFTLEEFAHLVSRAIRSLSGAEIGDDEIVYSQQDVFFTIVDVLGYISERTPGRFKFSQTSFQNYMIHYIAPNTEKKKGAKSLVLSKAQSALDLKKMTGRYPAWAEKDDAVMQAITDIIEKPKAAPSDATHKALDNRADVAVQIHNRTGEMPDWVAADPRLQKKVDALLKGDEKDGMAWLKGLVNDQEGDSENG